MPDQRHRDEPDDLRLAAWRGLLNVHALAIGAIDRELAAAGLVPLAWYDVLVALWETPGHRLRLHELAERVVLSRSGLTRLVDRLEAAGLLRREPCVEDRRGAYAALTAKGEQTLRDTWPTYGRGILEHFARHLSQEQARTIVDAFEGILAAERTPESNNP